MWCMYNAYWPTLCPPIRGAYLYPLSLVVDVCEDHYVDIEQVCQQPDVEVGPLPCRASSVALCFVVALGIFQTEVVSCITVCGHDSVHTSQLALHVVGVTTEVGQKCLSDGRVVAFRAGEVS